MGKNGFTELVCERNVLNVNFVPFSNVSVVTTTDETIDPLFYA